MRSQLCQVVKKKMPLVDEEAVQHGGELSNHASKHIESELYAKMIEQPHQKQGQSYGKEEEPSDI